MVEPELIIRFVLLIEFENKYVSVPKEEKQLTCWDKHGISE